MHVYAFGSICRGEIDRGSDVDLLAIADGHDQRFDPLKYSVYSYERLRDLWRQGNPFAWHLALESRMVFASDGDDFLRALGTPAVYAACREDCLKFQLLFADACRGLAHSRATLVFDLSVAFLATRNIASCFSLGRTADPRFGRDAALQLGRWSLPVDPPAYDALRRARILSTRGLGPRLTRADVEAAEGYLPVVGTWMDRLVTEVSKHD